MSTLADRMTWRDGQLRVSQCGVCVHKHRGAATCTAFPDGIPADVLRNVRSHAHPIDGDGGVVLEPVEVARATFEAMTGLAFPEGAYAIDDVEGLLAADIPLPAVSVVLQGVSLLLARDATPPGEDGLRLRTMPDGDGRPHVMLFTSLPRLEAFLGTGTPYVRCRLTDFPDGFGEGVGAVVNPGSDGMVLDLA